MKLRSVSVLLMLVASCRPSPTRPPVSHASGDEAARSAVSSDADPFADDVEPSGDGTAGGTHRGSAIATLGITPPDVPFDEMSTYDREMYMAGKVLPIMQELFASHDRSRFPSVTCESCHGTDMREVAFRMPSRSAMPIPAVGTAAFVRMERQFPDSVRFMRDTLTPAMGRLLGAESYDCSHCHPTSSAP